MSAVFLLSCASTTLLSSWKDDSYDKKIKNVLVIGGANKPGIRRIFEREFANQLEARGVNAYPSNSIIPSDKMLDKDTIVSKISGMNIDAVLITTLVDEKTVKTYQASWYNNYTYSYGRTFVDKYFNLETNLYDAETEGLIWSALSETVIMEDDSNYERIKSFIKIIVDKLSKDGLV